MNTKKETLAGLLEAAHKITQELAHDLKEDAKAIRAGETEDGFRIDQPENFAVGALLPVEKAAQDLLAILAAAKVFQGLK